MLASRISIFLVLLTAAFSGCKSSKPQTAAPEQQASRPSSGTPDDSSTAETHVEMRNVNFHLYPDSVLRIRRLTGKLVPREKGKPSSFDDKRSFTLAIDSAETAMDAASLTVLMNNYVFAGEDSPLSDLKIALEKGRIKQTGKMKKGVPIPFEMEGTLDSTPDGRIRIHAEKMKTVKIPVKGLLNLFGADLADVVKAKGSRGVEIVDDDIFLDPEKIIPPPQIRGRLTSAKIEGNTIVQVFGKPAPAPKEGRNYMTYRGGTLQFGNLTMHDADLELIDTEMKDPFDYFLDRYQEQLVAGYTKTMPDKGLRVFMPDFSRLNSKAARTK